MRKASKSGLVLALLFSLLWVGGCKLNVRQKLYESRRFSSYYAVAASDEQHAWVVGTAGTIRFNDGRGWVTQQSPVRYSLFGVTALRADLAWAVGEKGVVLNFDGSQWAKVDSGTAQTLVGVFALDRTHVWAVGKSGTILYFDGHVWSKQQSGVDWDLNGVTATDANHVWVTGKGGILFGDGSTWSRQWEGDQGNPPLSLRSISAQDAKHVWAVGNPVGNLNISSAAVLFFDGKAWRAEYKLPDDQFCSICAEGSRVWASTSKGMILVRDGRWQPLFQAPIYTSLLSVHALADDAWAVGFRWNAPVIYSMEEGRWVNQGR